MSIEEYEDFKVNGGGYMGIIMIIIIIVMIIIIMMLKLIIIFEFCFIFSLLYLLFFKNKGGDFYKLI